MDLDEPLAYPVLESFFPTLNHQHPCRNHCFLPCTATCEHIASLGATHQLKAIGTNNTPAIFLLVPNSHLTRKDEVEQYCLLHCCETKKDH